ncbi:DJ-1/PfpI family protein [Flavobacterium pectinovorum]|uniref:DJ-1/PfpI family protein n=1 Tax=Flavobacterium pectinovorum TaxID=29533 RepID=UPI00265F7567|nr:DJ-1/PfpI family protein [Flavobacterium pectinovorum]WKL47874.1 DJ-1/PfpI family protein [Flavobacterium pectinovorum]
MKSQIHELQKANRISVSKQILYVILASITFFGCNNSSKENPEQKPATHQEIMSRLDKPKLNIKTVGILLYDNFSTMDAMGPYQVLSEMMGTQVFFVSKHKGIIKNSSGVKIQVDRDFSDTKNLDILLIPGGGTETLLLTKDKETLEWIKKIDKTTQFTTSVCNGAWILGATGLLKGKNATSHWYNAKEMLTMYGATFQQERWVRDGKYWTSAGITAGIDMSLAIVQEVRGDNYLKITMLDLEYDPKPPLQGGSVTNTDKETVKMMKEMYDSMFGPILDSLKTVK